MWSTDEFLARFGDMIDDRVAEVLEELARDRPPPRLRSALAALLIALIGGVVARHSVLAVSAIWLSTAAVYLVAVRATGRRGS
jgi:hypothetical protein